MSFRNSDLSEYPESELVVSYLESFELFNQKKLTTVNISGCNSPRKPRLLFNGKTLGVNWLNLLYRMDIMGGFVKVEINIDSEPTLLIL